jgi:hypothetical protein
VKEVLERIDAAARQGGFNDNGTSPSAMMLLQIGSALVYYPKRPERMEQAAAFVQELRGWCEAAGYEGDPVADLFEALEGCP